MKVLNEVPQEVLVVLQHPAFRLAVTLIIFVVLSLVVHRLVMGVLLKIAKKTEGDWDDLWLARIRRPLHLGFLAVAVSLALEFSAYKFSEMKLVQGVLKSAFILSMFWCFERLFFTLLQKGVLLTTITPGARNFLGTLFRLLIMTIGILMVLDSAGISITPLLASLGVGSLAVALALQDTLSNFFSGIYILADKPFRLGDFVQIESGEQGYVEKIGWRSTHLRMISNNHIVIPNTKIASNILTNYDLIEQQTALTIPVGVGYGADLNKVESVAIEVAKEVSASVEGGVPDIEPSVRFKEFADSSINFNLVVRVQKFEDHFLIRHELIKRLHARFLKEGIEIPFPQRVVHMVPSK